MVCSWPDHWGQLGVLCLWPLEVRKSRFFWWISKEVKSSGLTGDLIGYLTSVTVTGGDLSAFIANQFQSGRPYFIQSWQRADGWEAQLQEEEERELFYVCGVQWLITMFVFLLGASVWTSSLLRLNALQCINHNHSKRWSSLFYLNLS